MKVLHLIDSGGLYGAEKMLLALVAEQNAMGVEATICSVGLPGENEKAIEYEANKAGLPLKPWRMQSGLNLKGALGIELWALQEGYTLLHSHGYKFNILWMLLRKRKKQLPFLVTVHGYVKAARFKKMWLYEKLDHYALKQSDQVCVVSKPMLMHPYLKGICLSKVSCIPNGISNSNSEQTLGLDADLFRSKFSYCFCAVGRLSSEKGFMDLILAFEKLLTLNPLTNETVGLVIFGEGGLKEPLRLLINQRQLQKNILLAGYQKNVGSTLRMFHGLVISSITEGLPITLLEAMNARCPVISTKVGGIPSVVTNNSAYLCDVGNLEQIANAMYSVMKDSQLAKRKASVAYQYLISHYTAKEMATRYLRCYEQTIRTFEAENNIEQAY